MYKKIEHDRWMGPIDGVEEKFTVIGTTGSQGQYPVVKTDDGRLIGLNWESETSVIANRKKENHVTDITMTIAKELDGRETYMAAILVDSYGDKLLIPLYAETIIQGGDYFVPCNSCGVTVLDCSIVPGTDNVCGRCYTNQKKEETKMARYKFTLMFDNKEFHDFHNVRDEEISRVLNEILNLGGDFNADAFNLYQEIESANFYARDGIENGVISSMLKMLMTTGLSQVAYCFDCDSYTVSHERRDVCAYDTDGKYTDSHRVFRIIITDLASPDGHEYMCFWGDGYEPRTPLEVKFSYFTEANGYSHSDQTFIFELGIGESMMVHTTGNHTIVRTK